MTELRIDKFDFRTYFKRWPVFYYFIATFFGPMMFCGLSSKNFIKKYSHGGKILNVGSGPRVLAHNVVNVDIYPYKGVSIVAGAQSLPFKNEEIELLIYDNVLEHIQDPDIVIGEMKRVLVRGGCAYIATPFMYPFHSSPNDYSRWTEQGIRQLLIEFEVEEIGVRAGPFSALTVYVCHIFSIIFSFGIPTLHSLLLNTSMFIFFPIKLLDLIFNYWPNAISMAAVIYVVAKKK